MLRLPLVWPEGTSNARAAMRVASLACERGRGGAFVLAASRLAFCGGFELDDPEVLAEAAAAANLPLADAFEAATDETRDGAMVDDALRLLAGGAEVLPAVRVGRLVFSGEDRLNEAAAAAQAATVPVRRSVPRAGVGRATPPGTAPGGVSRSTSAMTRLLQALYRRLGPRYPRLAVAAVFPCP